MSLLHQRLVPTHVRMRTLFASHRAVCGCEEEGRGEGGGSVEMLHHRFPGEAGIHVSRTVRYTFIRHWMKVSLDEIVFG